VKQREEPLDRVERYFDLEQRTLQPLDNPFGQGPRDCGGIMAQMSADAHM
jgi:hypothetical protein